MDKCALDNSNRRKSSLPLSELKNAGLLLNRLSRSGDLSGSAGISWVATMDDKENGHCNQNEVVDHIPRPFLMGSRVPDVKKKAVKTYDVNITAISSSIYDENWAAKQGSGFTDWMNFTFASSLESAAPTGEEAIVNSEGVIEGDASGLKILMQKKGEAVNRQRCFQIYHSADFVKVLKSVEEEICEGRLVVRDDRDVLADLGLQEELFSLLFSYEMPWIRLGLEIVFGEIISIHSAAKYMAYPCKSNCPKWKNVIKTFVMERLLANQDIIATYTKQQLLCVSYEKKMRSQTRQHLLKKFLGLVILLDSAKKKNVLLLPTLFVRDAPAKSSRDIILSFSREIMRGEGDVMRHLGLLGYSVSFVQTFIDEFDYTVKNLAVMQHNLCVFHCNLSVQRLRIMLFVCSLYGLINTKAAHRIMHQRAH